MKARGRVALATLTVIALPLLALPGGAAAKPGYYVSPESYFAIADLAGSNGYRVTIAALSPRYVALLATKRGSFANYYVRVPFDGKRIDALFGRLGRISVRFEPEGPAKSQRQPGDSCKGPASTSQSGHFVGTIRFRGERNFTTVRSSAAKATVFHGFRQVCKRLPKSKVTEPESEDKATSISAFVRGNPEGPVFTAYSVPPLTGPRAEDPNFRVTVLDRRPSMTVGRGASAGGGPYAFAVTPLGTVPATATVAPYTPFSGSATLTKSPGGATTWSGDLSVELPGLGTVPLTGPSFAAKLCRNISCACNRRQLCVDVSVVEGRLHRLLRLRRH